MNRTELVAAVAAEDGPFSKALADVAVDRVFGAITDALTRGEEVRLIDFGIFTVAERKAREGRNPATKEPMHIPAKRTAKLKPAKALRDALFGADR